MYCEAQQVRIAEPFLRWISHSALAFLLSHSIPQSVISPVMNIKLRMEGEVNGHKFTVEGEGEGKPFE